MRNVTALHIFCARKIVVDRYNNNNNNNNNIRQSFAQLSRRVIHVFNVAVTVKKICWLLHLNYDDNPSSEHYFCSRRWSYCCCCCTSRILQHGRLRWIYQVRVSFNWRWFISVCRRYKLLLWAAKKGEYIYVIHLLKYYGCSDLKACAIYIFFYFSTYWRMLQYFTVIHYKCICRNFS